MSDTDQNSVGLDVKGEADEWRPPEEASRLCDDAFRRLLKMPPKPHSEMKLGKPRGRKQLKSTKEVVKDDADELCAKT